MTRSFCAFALCLLVMETADAAVPAGRPLLIELPVDALGADVGAGGFVVLGNFYSRTGALLWMPTSGVTALGGGTGAAISRDGKSVVGDAIDDRGLENAAIWTGGTTWRVLGSFTPGAQPCDALLSSALGTSDDGKVIVGLGWDGCRYAHAFRWEESTGMVDLGTAVASQSTRANNVSGDGKVVVGWQEDETGVRRGAKWVNGAEEMIQGPHGNVGEAFAANRDGSLIVGGNCDIGNPVASAWTWTPAQGVQCFPVVRPQDLERLPYQALMLATSDDSRVIGGAFSFGGDSEALVWFDGEILFLKDYLRAHGIPDAFEGWINTGFARAVTPDGRTLVGYGAGPRGFQGYMVVLPDLASR